MFDTSIPCDWTLATNPNGSVIPNCWITPAKYTVTLTDRSVGPVAVFRQDEKNPFAYLKTLCEVPVSIAADQLAKKLPEESYL